MELFGLSGASLSHQCGPADPLWNEKLDTMQGLPFTLMTVLSQVQKAMQTVDDIMACSLMIILGAEIWWKL